MTNSAPWRLLVSAFRWKRKNSWVVVFSLYWFRLTSTSVWSMRVSNSKPVKNLVNIPEIRFHLHACLCQKKKKKQVALAEPSWAVVWDYLFAFLKKIVSSDVLSIFQMSLIKSNKSSNNGQPERSKVWQGANEKSESKQQNNLKSGNCKWLGHNRCYSLQLIWLRWQELQNQLKSRVKRKRGTLELHSTNIDLPTVITKSCDSDNQFHGFFFHAILTDTYFLFLHLNVSWQFLTIAVIAPKKQICT